MNQLQISYPGLFLTLVMIVHYTTSIATHSSISIPNSELKVFLDCRSCDERFIKSQIESVQYVRDRKVADIHILINVLQLGTGAKKVELNFIDLKQKETSGFRTSFDVSQNETSFELNIRMVKHIRAGLLPFMMERQPGLDFSLSQSEATVQIQEDTYDPWDYWVFEIGGDVDIEKESNQSEYELEGEIEIERTTEHWRFRSELSIRSRRKQVNSQDESISSSLRNMEAEASLVKSIGTHWAAGIFGSVRSNTFNNIRLGSRIQAAIEYNVFPYSSVASKEFTIAYYLGPRWFRYWEPTIYHQTAEQRFSHSLRANLDIKKAWGRVELRLEGSQYFHNFSRNRLEFSSRVSVRIINGLSVRVGAEASLIRDQLFLPKQDASLEDVLLQQRVLATDYELGAYVGISYTFGSIFNSVINTRL